MLSKKDLPYDITNKCYIDLFQSNYCLFYQKVPLIVVKYTFWTEDIHVYCDYIDYNEDERGYTLLIDVPSYDENMKRDVVDHVYYGLFYTIKELESWLKNPYLLY